MTNRQLAWAMFAFGAFLAIIPAAGVSAILHQEEINRLNEELRIAIEKSGEARTDYAKSIDIISRRRPIADPVKPPPIDPFDPKKLYAEMDNDTGYIAIRAWFNNLQQSDFPMEKQIEYLLEMQSLLREGIVDRQHLLSGTKESISTVQARLKYKNEKAMEPLDDHPPILPRELPPSAP